MKCDDANHVCDKSQYKEASLWEKIKLNLHLLYCAACRKYSSRNGKLTKVMKDSDLKSLDPDSKQVLKEQLHQEMSK